MRFRLSYITRDFLFQDGTSNFEIRVSNPDKGIEVVYKKRPKDGEQVPHDGGAGYEAYDGLIAAVCEVDLAERLHNEAVSSGVLSRNREAVQKIFEDMNDAIQRTVRLVRWKTYAIGGPNTIRTQNYCEWSVDGSNWKFVADSLLLTTGFSIIQLDRHWSIADAEFLQAEFMKGTDEPLGHELLREADENRRNNPRSSLILGVAAAEVGFKQFASKIRPDTAWLLELPSPPLVDMLQKFPWEQLKPRINGKIPAVPDSIIDELRKGVTLRNKIVHSGVARLSPETLDSLLDTVKDLLYFLDVLHGSGQDWPLNFIDQDVVKRFNQD
jgi:hypothetical protein